MRTFIFIIAICALSSCEKILMKPDAEKSNEAVFEEYVKLVKEKYAMLEFKEVNIDHLRDSLRPFVNNTMTSDSLFKTIAIITERLRDGHTSLKDPSSLSTHYLAGFDPTDGYPLALDNDILLNNYLSDAIAPNIAEIKKGETVLVYYGSLPQTAAANLGYIRIPNFDISLSDEQLESIFSAVKGKSGLILDVRGNGGGDPRLATKIASYFMSETTYAGYERFKTGPGTNDFVNSPANIKPSSSGNKFLNPVVVLTDRGVYSATTTLCYSLNPLSKVTFMGQRTGGGSGAVADGYLANGWIWQLSTSEFIDHEGRHLDDGINPDIQVSLNIDVMNVDEIVEAAIQHLQ